MMLTLADRLGLCCRPVAASVCQSGHSHSNNHWPAYTCAVADGGTGCSTCSLQKTALAGVRMKKEAWKMHDWDQIIELQRLQTQRMEPQLCESTAKACSIEYVDL